MSFKRLAILCKAPCRNRNRKNKCSDHHKHVTKKYVCNKDCFSTRMTGGGTGTVARSCFHLGPHGVHTECLSRRLYTTSELFTGFCPKWVGIISKPMKQHVMVHTNKRSHCGETLQLFKMYQDILLVKRLNKTHAISYWRKGLYEIP